MVTDSVSVVYELTSWMLHLDVGAVFLGPSTILVSDSNTLYSIQIKLEFSLKVIYKIHVTSNLILSEFLF